MGRVRKRMIEMVQSAAPSVETAARLLGPVLEAAARSFTAAIESARAQLDVFRAALAPAPRRRRARKPCAWCTDRYKRPAVYRVKWRKSVTFHDEFDNMPVTWTAKRTLLMCDYHASVAERYDGVTAYRFRRP